MDSQSYFFGSNLHVGSSTNWTYDPPRFDHAYEQDSWEQPPSRALGSWKARKKPWDSRLKNPTMSLNMHGTFFCCQNKYAIIRYWKDSAKKKRKPSTRTAAGRNIRNGCPVVFHLAQQPEIPTLTLRSCVIRSRASWKLLSPSISLHNDQAGNLLFLGFRKRIYYTVITYWVCCIEPLILKQSQWDARAL